MRAILGKKEAERLVDRILSEDVLTLAQAEQAIQEVTGQKPSRASLTRWIHAGKLEAIKLGNQLITSREAIQRFMVNRTSTLTVQS